MPDHPALRLTGSFSFTAWIAPTSQRGPTPDSFVGVEGVLTKWAGPRGGYGIFIDDEGRLALWISDASGKTEKLASGQPLRPWVPAIPGMNNRPQGVTTAWYLVAVTFDAGSGKVEIHQDPLNTFTFDPTRVVTERSATIRTLATNDSPLLIAGAWERADRVYAHFNGKIDNPRLYREVLSRQAIADIKQGQPGPPPLAAWDFAADIESERITDTGPVRLHGRTVNLPMRAVTGHNWDSFEMDYKQARQQYGAIHFHDDDIDDARWDVGFEFRVPDTLKSAMYAARLRGGSFEDYIPFTVRPKKGQPTSARIALLVPTFSYLAYAGTGTSAFRPLSLYSRHSDGSGVCYSSRLRPITNMRPKIQTNNPWQFMADTHLIDWLDQKSSPSTSSPTRTSTSRAPLAHAYKVVITGNHPEYWTGRDARRPAGYLAGGGRLMYLGGNGFYWVTADGSRASAPDRGPPLGRHRRLESRTRRVLPRHHRRTRRSLAHTAAEPRSALSASASPPRVSTPPCPTAALPAASIPASPGSSTASATTS